MKQKYDRNTNHKPLSEIVSDENNGKMIREETRRKHLETLENFNNFMKQHQTALREEQEKLDDYMETHKKTK